MNKKIVVALLAVIAASASAQEVSVSKGRLRQGDDMSWVKPEMDDASWSEVDITKRWDDQGFPQNTKAYGCHNSQLINDNVNGNSPQTTNVLPIEGESEGVFQFSTVRDVWRQKNLSPDERTWTIPPHGCRYLKLTY